MKFIANKILIVFILTHLFGCSLLQKTKKNQAEIKEVEPVVSQTSVQAILEPKSGYKGLTGTVVAIKVNGGLQLTASVSGLKPKSKHGFHVHAIGDCSTEDASGAGGHFSPNSGNKHGSHESPDRHAGDLGNLISNQEGIASVTRVLPGLNLKTDGPFSLRGRSVIVHENLDDLTSQPSGNSGKRIGCGIFK